MTPTYFHKVMFYSPKFGQTAGLVVKSDWLKDKSTSEISRLFPYSEAMKMTRLCVSQGFETWDEAFNHSFNIKEFRK